MTLAAALCGWISSVPASKSGRAASLARGQGHTCSSRLFRSQYRCQQACPEHDACLPLFFWIAPTTRFLGTARVRAPFRIILPGASPSARAASTLHVHHHRAGLSLFAQHAARARCLELAQAARGQHVKAASLYMCWSARAASTRRPLATNVKSRMQAGMMLLPTSSAWCLALNATKTRLLEGYCVRFRHNSPGRERPKFKHCCCWTKSLY